MPLQTPCKNCGDRLVQHRDGKCWVVPGVGAFCKCPGYEADYEATAEIGLRHANMQDALATAFAKGTGQDKEEVLDQLRELTRREP